MENYTRKKEKSKIIKKSSMSTYNIVSIDLETTGLDSESCQILEIGLVFDNTTVAVERENIDEYIKTLPTARCYVKHKRIQGEPYALMMNASIIRQLALSAPQKFCIAEDGTEIIPAYEIAYWIKSHIADIIPKEQQKKVTVAGKNFQSFDLRFLQKVEDWYEAEERLNRRVLDPGSLYFDPLEDNVPPSLEDCLLRAGFDKKVTHTAVDDAKDVLRVLRAYWARQPKLDDNRKTQI